MPQQCHGRRPEAVARDPPRRFRVTLEVGERLPEEPVEVCRRDVGAGVSSEEQEVARGRPPSPNRRRPLPA